MLTAVATFACALLFAGSGALGYGPAPVSTWVVSGGQPGAGGGTVKSIAVAGSTAYVGGNFSYIGPPSGSAASLQHLERRGQPDLAGDLGQRLRDRRRREQRLVRRRRLRLVGTTHCDNLVHIKADGTIDTAWQAATNGPVFSLLALEHHGVRRRRIHDRRTSSSRAAAGRRSTTSERERSPASAPT